MAEVKYIRKTIPLHPVNDADLIEATSGLDNEAAFYRRAIRFYLANKDMPPVDQMEAMIERKFLQFEGLLQNSEGQGAELPIENGQSISAADLVF